MNCSLYFKEFEYLKKAKSTKVSPFILQAKDYSYLLNYNYTIKELNELIKRFKLPKCKKKKKREIRHFYTNIFLTRILQKYKNYGENTLYFYSTKH